MLKILNTLINMKEVTNSQEFILPKTAALLFRWTATDSLRSYV